MNPCLEFEEELSKKKSCDIEWMSYSIYFFLFGEEIKAKNTFD